MSILKDLETYKAVFGIENIVYSHNVLFTFKDNGIDRTLISSAFLTAEHITIISTKNNLKYRIPLGNIININTERKVLKYFVHLEYGNQYKHYKASLDFTNKSDGQVFISLLSLAVEVDRKRVDLENTYENEMTKIQEYKDKELTNINEEKRKISNNISNLKIENEKLKEEINIKQEKIKELDNNIKDKIFNSELKDIFVNHFEENITSKELKDKLSMLSLDEKDMVKNDEAINYSGYDEKKSYINSQIKQILRAFNTECDYLFSSLNARNYENYHNKIVRSFETLNRIYKVDKVEITREYLQIKLEKLNLINEHAIKLEQEKELQREIKEQMKEEEKVRRELEQQEKKIEKEERQFGNEIKSLFKRLEKTKNDIEKELYADKIRELEEKVKQLEEDKKDVENRKLNTRAGYVYVISNIGSFGEGIYKIGLTRRLEPYDRVKELGDASVPFEFDVHAMIFSDDAPALENTLHRHFRDRELNKVNHRKEFFRVDIDEIEEVVKNNHNDTVEFTKIPVAEQYRESQNINE